MIVTTTEVSCSAAGVPALVGPMAPGQIENFARYGPDGPKKTLAISTDRYLRAYSDQGL